MPSTKRVMTPLLCLQSRGAAVQYCSTLFRVVQYCPFAPSLRVQRYNKICGCARKWGFFFAIFWIMDAHEGYGILGKGGHLAIDPIVKVAESLTNH